MLTGLAAKRSARLGFQPRLLKAIPLDWQDWFQVKRDAAVKLLIPFDWLELMQNTLDITHS